MAIPNRCNLSSTQSPLNLAASHKTVRRSSRHSLLASRTSRFTLCSLVPWLTLVCNSPKAVHYHSSPSQTSSRPNQINSHLWLNQSRVQTMPSVLLRARQKRTGLVEPPAFSRTIHLDNSSGSRDPQRNKCSLGRGNGRNRCNNSNNHKRSGSSISSNLYNSRSHSNMHSRYNGNSLRNNSLRSNRLRSNRVSSGNIMPVLEFSLRVPRSSHKRTAVLAHKPLTLKLLVDPLKCHSYGRPSQGHRISRMTVG